MAFNARMMWLLLTPKSHPVLLILSHLLAHSLLFLVGYCLPLPSIYIFYLLAPIYSSSLDLNASGKPFLTPQV